MKVIYHGAASVSPFRLDRESPLLTWAHIQQALIPTLDDLALADGEPKGLATVVAGIENGAVLESSTVMDLDAVTRDGLAFAFHGMGGLDIQGLLELLGGGDERRQEAECENGREVHCGKCSVGCSGLR